MSELEKTIEQLEAEVLAELEEASEKPLGKGTDVESKDAGKSVSKAKDPAPNAAGADKAEKVEDGQCGGHFGGAHGRGSRAVDGSVEQQDEGVADHQPDSGGIQLRGALADGRGGFADDGDGRV